jgi:hypothetical protein
MYMPCIYESRTENHRSSFFSINSISTRAVCYLSYAIHLLLENTVYCTLETSKGLDRILEDISATRGIPRVSGIKGNSTPAT